MWIGRSERYLVVKLVVSKTKYSALTKEKIKFDSVRFRLGLLFIGGVGALTATILILSRWTSTFIKSNPSLITEIVERNSAINYVIILLISVAAFVVFFFSIKYLKEYIFKLESQDSQLQITSDRMERFFENSSDLVYELDEHSRYIYVNKTVEKIIGYSNEELRNRSCWEFVPEEYLATTKDYYIDIIRKKEKSGYHEFPIHDKDGNLIWLGQSVDFIYEGDKAIRAYTIAKDISDQKNAANRKEKYRDGLRLLNELGAKTSKNYLELLSEGLTLCSEFLNLDLGIVSDVKDNQYTITDYVPTDAGLKRGQTFELGSTYCDITLKAKKTIAIDEMSTSEYSAHPCYGNFQLESYIGASYSVKGEVRGTVNFTSPDARKKIFTEYDIDFVTLVARWVGTIIENHESMEAIEQEQAIMTAFVSTAPAAIAMFDLDMKYLAASQKWYDEYRVKTDLTGVSHYEAFPAAEERKIFHDRALNGEVVGEEEECFELDGEELWLKWEIRPWFKSDKKIGGVIYYTDDITAMKHQQKELEKAKEEAEMSGQIKAQFLSTMSHEIRTPLNAIIGTTNLLELEHPELAGNERMKMLKFGSSNLLSLINDVLDFQKIESNHLEINQFDFNLKELASNLIETWQGVGNESDIELILNYDESLQSFYKGDPVRLGQIINNLISNSLKFTEKGTVSLKISGPKKGEIQFEIADTGIGIPADKLESIFDSFKQISSEKTAKRGGTGLGLSISKKLVSLMNGNLTATSEVGVGSSFKFTIPMEDSKSQAESKVSSFEIQKMDMKALLVEDNAANQAIATSFLDRWGIKVDVANNGKEALDKIVNQSYDVVLMDIRMPIMTGYEASRQIRKMEGDYFSKVPIIALTASNLLNSEEKVDECGINAFVSKPFNPNDLFEQIAKVTSLAGKKTLEGKGLESFVLLSQFYGDDKKQIRKVIRLSIESINESIEKIDQGFQAKDSNMIHEGLHVLRPSLSYVNLNQFVERLPVADSGDAWDEIPALLEDIREELVNINTDF